jgi:hypothetical protein
MVTASTTLPHREEDGIAEGTAEEEDGVECSVARASDIGRPREEGVGDAWAVPAKKVSVGRGKRGVMGWRRA